MYKFLEHTADVKFVASGKTVEDAFVSSFEALKESICGKIEIKPAVKRLINIKGKDFESLLYNFLEEFLYLLDADNFIPGKVNRIEIDSNNFFLEAEVSGDCAGNYKFTNDVKAVTYNSMFVKQEKGKFVCQVVLDV